MQEDTIVALIHRGIDESPRIHQIESDISTLKSDVSTLKSDVSSINGRLQSLTDESRRQGVLMEGVRSDMNKLIEVVMQQNLRIDQSQRTQTTVQDHSDRLVAVEDTLKRHIKNRRAHRSVESP